MGRSSVTTPSEPDHDRAAQPTSSIGPAPLDPAARIDLVKGDDSAAQTQIVPPIDDFRPVPDPYQATQMAPYGDRVGDPWASNPQPPYHPQQPNQVQPDYSQIQFAPPAVPGYGQPAFAAPPAAPGYGQPDYHGAAYGAYGAQYPMPGRTGSDPKAIIALILGVISFPLVFACYLGVGTAIVAAVLGGVAIAEANRTQNRTNRLMAIGGLALAIVDFLLMILLLVAVFAVS